VISDMAPDTIGAGDAERSAHLCRDVLALLPGVLRRGGACLMKVLEGAEQQALLGECRELFRAVRCTKPKATREVSREIYIVCRGYGNTR